MAVAVAAAFIVAVICVVPPVIVVGAVVEAVFLQYRQSCRRRPCCSAHWSTRTAIWSEPSAASAVVAMTCRCCCCNSWSISISATGIPHIIVIPLRRVPTTCHAIIACCGNVDIDPHGAPAPIVVLSDHRRLALGTTVVRLDLVRKMCRRTTGRPHRQGRHRRYGAGGRNYGPIVAASSSFSASGHGFVAGKASIRIVTRARCMQWW